MFIEAHKVDSADADSLMLAFIKSLNVQAFPCGRRRSQLVNGPDDNNDGRVNEDEKYYIPFDPEARLNTEANNRKHSSLNGYTQTYIKEWEANADLLSLVLGGYLFNVKLDSDYRTFAEFGTAIAEKVGNTSATEVYANIRIEEVALYSGFADYTTGVLRNQTDTQTAETEIDFLAGTKTNQSQSPDSYYFSGLSFSTAPLSGKNTMPYSEDLSYKPDSTEVYQRIISLRILEKVGGFWQVYQPALLPKVEHGTTENSIKVGTVYTDNVKQGGFKVPSLTLENLGNNTFKMHFSAVDDYVEKQY
jgi:hypothetical protein